MNRREAWKLSSDHLLCGSAGQLEASISSIDIISAPRRLTGESSETEVGQSRHVSSADSLREIVMPDAIATTHQQQSTPFNGWKRPQKGM